jgi:hypothetical protein
MRIGIFSLLLVVGACLAAPARGQWYGSLDFVTPARSDAVDTVFQRNQVEVLDANGVPTGAFEVGPTSVLTADDVKVGLAPGGRVIFGFQGEETGIEGSFLYSEDWIGSAEVGSNSTASDGLFASPFSPPGAEISPQFDDNVSASLCYFTNLQTAELHLTQLIWSGPQGTATVLGGIRYVSIDEELTYDSVNAGGANQLLTDTTNNLLGPQVGLISEAPLYGGFLNLSLKFGLASNWFEKTTNFNGTVGTCEDATASALGEFGIEYLFVPRPWLAIRVGYQLLAISEVVLATDNFEANTTLLQSGVVKVEKDGVLYGIPYVGITCSF